LSELLGWQVMLPVLTLLNDMQPLFISLTNQNAAFLQATGADSQAMLREAL